MNLWELTTTSVEKETILLIYLLPCALPSLLSRVASCWSGWLWWRPSLKPLPSHLARDDRPWRDANHVTLAPRASRCSFESLCDGWPSIAHPSSKGSLECLFVTALYNPIKTDFDFFYSQKDDLENLEKPEIFSGPIILKLKSKSS
jgi:hypothetical protein